MRDTMAQAQAGVTDFQENMEALKHNFFLRGYFKSRGYEDSAELAKNEIEGMPQGTPVKEFTYSSKQLFDKQDSAKLKNQKSLHAGGEFLADNQFGFARGRGIRRQRRRCPEGTAANRSAGHGCARVSGRELWIR